MLPGCGSVPSHPIPSRPAASQDAVMLRQRCGRLLARLERVLQLLELGGSVEEGGCA